MAFQRTPGSSTDVIAIFLVLVYAAAAIVAIGLVHLFARVIVGAFRARRSTRPDNSQL